MLQSIKKLILTFDKYGINYVHWKSNEHLNLSLKGDTDLDILFDYNQRKKIEKVLIECNLKRFRGVPLIQYNGIEDYIGFDKEEAKIWHLHLHYRLTLGEKFLKGYNLPYEQILLKSKEKSESGIFIANSYEEIILLYIRMALKIRWRDFMKKISRDDINELKWLKEKTDVKKLNISLIFKNLSIFSQKEIVNLYNNENLKNKLSLVKLQKLLRKEFKNFTGYNSFTSWYTRTKREFFWILGGIKKRLHLNSKNPSRRVLPIGGLCIAFVGCDGAGKSTIIKYIRKEFSKKIDVVDIYLGSGDGSCSFLRFPLKIVMDAINKNKEKKGIKKSSQFNTNNNNVKSLKNKIMQYCKILWAITLTLEKKQKIKKTVRCKNQGMLVLLDRFPQVQTMGYNDGPLLYNMFGNKKGLLRIIKNWEYKLYKKFQQNQPDLLIKLMCKPETALARKPEMTLEDINRKNQVINNMNIGINTKTIYTDNDKNKTFSNVMEVIWEHL